MTTRAEVAAEALSWERTPYHHLADIKGVGVDCAMLLVRVFTGLGLAPADLDPRPYSPDWHLHRSEEQFLGWLEQFADRVGTPQMGDVVVWRFGRAYSHGGILVDDHGTIVHAYKEAMCVTRGSIHETELQNREPRYYSVRGLS